MLCKIMHPCIVLKCSIHAGFITFKGAMCGRAIMNFLPFHYSPIRSRKPACGGKRVPPHQCACHAPSVYQQNRKRDADAARIEGASSPLGERTTAKAMKSLAVPPPACGWWISAPLTGPLTGEQGTELNFPLSSLCLCTIVEIEAVRQIGFDEANRNEKQ